VTPGRATTAFASLWLLAATATTPACTKRDVPAPTSSSSAPTSTPTSAPTSTSNAATTSNAPPSGGCGGSTGDARGKTHTTRTGRTFHVWGPSSYDANRPYPVVLTFHGWYTNGRDFEKWFKMEDHVEGAAFTVYPDSKGPAWDLVGTTDLDFTADIIDALKDAYCIDRTHVFALGFSYGGKLVHHLGCKRPDLVRAISVGDGSWHEESGCRPLPVLVTHRTRDDDELFAWGRSAAQRWAKVDGCSEPPEEVDAAHGCVAYRACRAPGSVTFCEDRHFDATWPKDWNHTIREEYRSLTWSWFTKVP